MTIVRNKTLALALVALTAGCGGDDLPPGPPPGPSGPGLLAVVLETPNSNDGALLLRLSGGRMDSLRVSQLTLLAANTGTNERRVMLAGNISAGVVLRFWVPERRDLAGYSVVLEQVATRAIYVQQPLDGYSLSVKLDLLRRPALIVD